MTESLDLFTNTEPRSLSDVVTFCLLGSSIGLEGLVAPASVSSVRYRRQDSVWPQSSHSSCVHAVKIKTINDPQSAGQDEATSCIFWSKSTEILSKVFKCLWLTTYCPSSEVQRRSAECHMLYFYNIKYPTAVTASWGFYFEKKMHAEPSQQRAKHADIQDVTKC